MHISHVLEDCQQVAVGCDVKQLQVYDKEPESCRAKLFEYKVTFPPRFVKPFVILSCMLDFDLCSAICVI